MLKFYLRILFGLLGIASMVLISTTGMTVGLLEDAGIVWRDTESATGTDSVFAGASWL